MRLLSEVLYMPANVFRGLVLPPVQALSKAQLSLLVTNSSKTTFENTVFILYSNRDYAPEVAYEQALTPKSAFSQATTEVTPITL